MTGSNSLAGVQSWVSSHGARRVLLLFGALLLLEGTTRASEPQRAASQEPSSEEPPRELGIGLTLGSGDVGVGATLFGFDAWYRPFESLAFGVEPQGFIVDNGADAHYCYGCLAGGTLITGFVEGRLGAGRALSGFGRIGLGVANLHLTANELGQPDEERTDPLVELKAGPQLSIGHVFVRGRVGATLTSESFLGYGVELGGLF